MKTRELIGVGTLGTLLGIAFYLLSNKLGLSIPPEVAVAAGTIVGWLVGRLFGLSGLAK